MVRQEHGFSDSAEARRAIESCMGEGARTSAHMATKVLAPPRERSGQ